jgi:2-polyprenyl-3-methyl-5-hydroxy-6-metoxy-1,4-benzoquinol methylase
MMSCLLCGSCSLQPQYVLGGYSIARCRACGLEFNPDFRDGDGQDGSFGPEYYLERHKAAFAAPFRDYREDPSLAVFMKRLDQIAERRQPGTLIDVGCGPGTFLRAASERGWRVQGVEISRFAVERARATHGLPIFTGMLQALDWPSESVDVITFWDSLEHVLDPLDTLRAARRLLRPDGLILVATDNFDCLVADMAVTLYRTTLGRFQYPMRRVFIDRNRSYFTIHTLQHLLRRAEFRTVWLERMEYPLEKIDTTWAERLALRAIYAAAGAFGRQAQVTLLAERT